MNRTALWVSEGRAAKLQNLYYARISRHQREEKKCKIFWENAENPKGEDKIRNPFTNMYIIPTGQTYRKLKKRCGKENALLAEAAREEEAAREKEALEKAARAETVRDGDADKDGGGTNDNMLKNITGFFKTIKVIGLGEANVKKIIKMGGDTVAKIIAMSVSDLMTVDGFKEKMATKIHNSIHNQIEVSSVARLARASNIFGRGFGEKKIQIILENEPTDELIFWLIHNKKLMKLNGLAGKMAGRFIEKIAEFKEFMIQAKLEYKLTQTEAPKQAH